MKSILLAVQPDIGELTYLIHPLLLSIYALFSYEKIEKMAKIERGRPYDDEISNLPPLKLDYASIKIKTEETEPKFIRIRDNRKLEEEQYSRIAFINLDGYESEYNI